MLSMIVIAVVILAILSTESGKNAVAVIGMIALCAGFWYCVYLLLLLC